MSKKVLRTVAVIAAVAVNFIPGLGQVAALGIQIGVGALLSTGIAIASGVLLKPKGIRLSGATQDRLSASLDPSTPRKIIYGSTAMATDVRYQAFTGTDQEYYHQITCVASHEVDAIEEIWFDTELAWTAAGGVQGRYSGYLTVTPRLVGTAANGISIDGVWTSACTLTGCAYLYLRYKLTGNSKKVESPFQQIPSRVTVRGRGARLPDPRFDSTAGGSGAQLVTDQATWAYSTSGIQSGRNPALQLLHYLVGWKINGKLAIGRGMPSARFDMGSFITAANMCDEAVARSVGGTEPRYRSDGAFSEGDDPSTVIDNLLASMNAVLRDDGGRISLHVLHNDLGSPVAHFDENDILGDERWQQTPSIDQSFNLVRGRYTDPSNEALYQMVDAPEVSTPSVDDIDRIDSFDVAVCQSPSQWQRLAKQRLQRNLYPGVYSANFGARAWQVSLGNVITLSHVGLGWNHKPFRVISHGIAVNGVVPMALREENAAIYAWDKEERPAVQAAVPTLYDPTKNALLQSILSLYAPGQNALYNGGFTLDLAGWNAAGWYLSKDWRGNLLQPPQGTGGLFVAPSQMPIGVSPGEMVTLSASFTGFHNSGAQIMFVDIEWRNGGNDALLSYSSTPTNGGAGDVSWIGLGNWTGDRKHHSFAAPAPNDGSGFVKAYVRTISSTDFAATDGLHGIGQIKVEMGSQPTPFSDEATDGANMANATGRLASGTTLPTNWNIGIKALNLTGFALSDSAAGGTVTLNVGASIFRLDDGRQITYPSASLPGLAYGIKYYVYRNDPDLNGGSSYGVSANLVDALGPGKVYLGFFTTRATSGGTGGGGSGGRDDCVAIGSHVLTQGGAILAEQVGTEDRLRALGADLRSLDWTPIEGNEAHENECVTIRTRFGAELTLALNTPCVTESGAWVIAANAWMARLPVLHHGELVWDDVVALDYAGLRPVAAIKCHNATYAAGADPDLMILTHNPIDKP